MQQDIQHEEQRQPDEPMPKTEADRENALALNDLLAEIRPFLNTTVVSEPIVASDIIRSVKDIIAAARHRAIMRSADPVHILMGTVMTGEPELFAQTIYNAVAVYTAPPATVDDFLLAVTPIAEMILRDGIEEHGRPFERRVMLEPEFDIHDGVDEEAQADGPFHAAGLGQWSARGEQFAWCASFPEFDIIARLGAPEYPGAWSFRVSPFMDKPRYLCGGDITLEQAQRCAIGAAFLYLIDNNRDLGPFVKALYGL